MDKLKDSFFQAYFNMPVPRIVVRTDTPDYTIIAVNNAYLSANGITADVFTEQSLLHLLNTEKTGTECRDLLIEALHKAIQINEPVHLSEFKVFSTYNSYQVTHWWQIELLPVAEANEKPQYLVISIRDITQEVLNKKYLEEARNREQLLHEDLAATNEELLASNEELSATMEELKQSEESLRELNFELENIVEERTADLLEAQARLQDHHNLLETIVNEVPAGICVLKGTDMIIETANTKIFQLWERRGTITGKPLLEIMPEIKEQEFPRLLNEVYTTGIAYSNTDAAVEIIFDGVKETVYRDYSYTPLKNPDGTTHSILAMTIDVTERTLARIREQQLMEEQFAINEELSASNEELATTNDKLSEYQKEQQQLIASLAESESRFRNLVMEAPVSICVLKGSNHVIDAINTECLKLMGKTSDVVHQTLKETLPELENQPFLELLDRVYLSGETYYGNEVLAAIEHQGKMVNGYFNFIYQPLKGDNGSVEGIMIVATEVTDLVTARIERENAEAKLGLAIEAARIGSWHIDRNTMALKYNSTLATLFGYEGTEPMTYDQAIAQVTEDCRERLVGAIEKAIADGGDYDVTYTQHRFNDNEVIWLRSLGKIAPDEQGNYTIFSGIVMDITEQKQDEQRKNDFIGMVSHELKTPLTSLTGYAQLLQSRARKNEDMFSLNALTKVALQAQKMTAMINGFLNISRLESGKIQLNKQVFNLDELIEENIEESEILIVTHTITFRQCEPVSVFADRDKIGSVISNMISNAVKYSPEAKEIEVNCEVIGLYAQISVKDYGMGIDPDDIEKLFGRFYRVENKQTQLISGFGIGLYLSAEIVERHHGKIWVESEPGVGSTFFFNLPVAPALA